MQEWMMNLLKVTQLNIYPVKSCQAISLSNMVVNGWGPENDRRLMLVDVSNKFVTARKYPKLLTVQIAQSDAGLWLSSLGKQTLHVDLRGPEISRAVDMNVQIWRDQVPALKISQAADRWFSELLELSVYLVYMPESTVRQTDRNYYEDDQRVSFADSFPFLLTHQSSLNELNERLQDALPMQRFRPNIVVSGGKPWAEDSWRKIRIGSIAFEAVKPCSRCIMTTIDSKTLHSAKEPLKTLSRYRRTDLGIIFGQNLVNLQHGAIALGDKVEVL